MAAAAARARASGVVCWPLAPERWPDLVRARAPVEPRGGTTADVFAYTGIASVFRAAGFREAARRSATRPLMRRELKPARRSARG